MIAWWSASNQTFYACLKSQGWNCEQIENLNNSVCGVLFLFVGLLGINFCWITSLHMLVCFLPAWSFFEISVFCIFCWFRDNFNYKGLLHNVNSKIQNRWGAGKCNKGFHRCSLTCMMRMQLVAPSGTLLECVDLAAHLFWTAKARPVSPVRVWWFSRWCPL